MDGTRLLVVAALAAGFGACDRTGNDQNTTTAPSTRTEPSNPTGQSKEDGRITADVRKAIQDDSSMSADAKNCTITTVSGVVTLQGAAASQAEKDSVEAKARAVSGVKRVDNQLKIKTES